MSYSLKHFAKHVSDASAQSDQLDAEVVTFFENGYFANEWEQYLPHELILAPGIYTPRIRDPLSFACYYNKNNSIAISKFTPFDAIQLTLKISLSLHLEVNTDHERLTSAGL